MVSTKPGYYPGEPVAIDVDDLPPLDGVLISHAHYDHCELQHFAAYRDHKVPPVVASTVVDEARKSRFDNVAAFEPWEDVDIGGVTITATPAKHAVHEVTFVLSAGSDAVYFAGDPMLIPELAQIPARLGHISVALLPTNGLQIRPTADMQVVMNAEEAAELTAIMRPELAVPHHYAFTSGWIGDRIITKSDTIPHHYEDASRHLAPQTSVRVVDPGVRVEP